MNDISVAGMMKTIIPITRFNKGEAARFFEEVETGGTKIVMKNNKPACVLLSPDKYESLMEMLSDFVLYSEAENRMASNNSSENISHSDMLHELGLSDSDLNDINVEIE